jgi:hypothetical protein
MTSEAMKVFDFVCLGCCIYEMVTQEFADAQNQEFLSMLSQLRARKVVRTDTWGKQKYLLNIMYKLLIALPT